jgi:hypothetical protein
MWLSSELSCTTCYYENGLLSCCGLKMESVDLNVYLLWTTLEWLKHVAF